MPIIVLFIVYSSVKSNIILQDTDFLSLLMNHKGKFIFYFFVSFIEEVIFRGIIFGLLLQKCKNKYLSCVIAALIFTLPHIFNTDNISVLVMFIFPFLYGIFANEMFYTTKSIWMPTGFHWLWVMELYNNKFVSCYRNTKFHICTYHSSNDYNDTVVLHCYWENTPKWRLIAYSLSLYTISTE